MKKNIRIIMLTISIVVLMISNIANAQDGAILFKDCAACHSIGGGRMVGPDLKGVTKRRTKAWLTQFIQSSTKLIQSGDPDAVAIFKEFNNSPMKDYPLTQEQIDELLDYISGGKFSGNEKIDPKKLAEQKLADSVLKGEKHNDILRGETLFNGEKRFANRGASCAVCHNVTYFNISNGGKLAKDLTNAFKRLNGYAGIKGVIGNPPYPSMLETYKNNPLTEVEIALLQLYLKSANNQNQNGPKKSMDFLLIIGSVLTVFIGVAICYLWRKRRRQSVNYAILKRQKKHSK